MGGWLPVGYQMGEFTAWLAGGIALAVASGALAGLAGPTRAQATWSGLLAGLVGSGALLAITTPYSGGLWGMWTAIGAILGAGAGSGTGSVGFFLKRRIRPLRGREGGESPGRLIP